MVTVVAAMMAAAMMATTVMRWAIGVVAAASVVVRVVVIVIVIPDMDTIAAMFVCPFDLRLEVGPLSVLVPFNSVVRVTSSIAKVPGIGVGNARVSAMFACVANQAGSWNGKKSRGGQYMVTKEIAWIDNCLPQLFTR